MTVSVPTLPPTQTCLSTVAIVMPSLMLCIATLLSLARYLGLENRVVDDEGREEGRGEQGKGNKNML